MFVGHLAVALGAKRLEPRISLGAFVAATFGLDLLWPIFVLLGVETFRIDPGNTAFTPIAFSSYPWSHSLLMAGVWGGVAGAAVYARKKSSRGAWIVAATVVSHWVLDFVTHGPDLPLWPGGPLAGLGLWNSIPATLIVEGGLLVAASILYMRTTRAIDRRGVWAFWSLVIVTSGIWVSQPLSPPPPGVTAVAVVGLTMWLLPVWAQWIERHRAMRNPVQAAVSGGAVA